jgi:hypothetical protein
VPPVFLVIESLHWHVTHRVQLLRPCDFQNLLTRQGSCMIMLWCLLIEDYTSVPSWQACRDRHIVLTSILVMASVSWAYCYGLESYPATVQ